MLANFILYWAFSHFCMRPNIEQIIQPSGHTIDVIIGRRLFIFPTLKGFDKDEQLLFKHSILFNHLSIRSPSLPVSVSIRLSLPLLTSLSISSFLQFKNGPFPASFFFIVVFSTVNSKHVHYKVLSMTGFKLQTSGFGSNLSTN